MSIPDPFSYELPEARIAQRPISPPESAKMLVVRRDTGVIEDRHFSDLPTLLPAGTRFVFNDTRVIPARLFGVLGGALGESSPPSGAAVEVLLVQRLPQNAGDLSSNASTWRCIGRPLKKIRKAATIWFSDRLIGEVLESPELESILVRFRSPKATQVEELLLEHGCMPIPPYIRNGKGDELDKSDYQTIFADKPGSVAAPTASLHFSPILVENMKRQGFSLSFITLHVGTASFQPVLVNGELKPPATEALEVSESVVQEMRDTRAAKCKVVAVGTTVTRALESAALGVGSGATELFITPGHNFKSVDVLVTNFHQPGTTHLLLVEAFLGRELLERVYHHALKNDYRFLSYGDGMIVL